jgi:Asp-tRNA(Asn)/Glu-tRNA(Gln) amidotransferase A subunit family amidase
VAADTEIADLTATEMLRLFGRGELSPVEAAKACLARIERYNDAVNAYCLLDPETTLAAARAAPVARFGGAARRTGWWTAFPPRSRTCSTPAAGAT